MPTAVSSAMCSFPSVEAAVNTAIQTIQEGVPVARIELANAAQMDAINKYSKLELPVAPTLWLEFHGSSCFRSPMYNGIGIKDRISDYPISMAG
jgi:D-lactate dehydrogenase (cytochrome)